MKVCGTELQLTEEQKVDAKRDLSRENKYELQTYVIEDGKKHPFAIICPGGAYMAVCGFNGGKPYAQKLNEIGISAFVLYYRCKEKAMFPKPMDDLARAVKEVFSKAGKWNLDTDHYSIWGSSAGGHLAATFGTECIGYQHYHLQKPEILVLCYPIVSMGEQGHNICRKNLLGECPSEEMIEKLSVERQITKNYPPVFMWCGEEDREIVLPGCKLMLQELKKHQILCQFTEYPCVGHGVGLGTGLSCEGWIEKAVEFWKSVSRRQRRNQEI